MHALPASPAQVPLLPPPLPLRFVDVEVLCERLGRVAFALGFFAGPALLAALDAVDVLVVRHFWQLLAAAWTTAIVGWLLVPAIARPRLARGSGRADERWLRASLVLPAVALSLSLPLTLHMPSALLLDGERGFDSWAALSIFVVGHAHVVLAYLAAARALRLIEDKPARSPARIYGLTVLASAIPGIALFGLPPLLTAATGVVLLPLLAAIESVIVSERLRLADA